MFIRDEKKNLFYIFNVVIQFKCDYKNRNGISQGSPVGTETTLF